MIGRKKCLAGGVVLGALVLGGASPAFADTLNISGPTTAHVGDSVVYQVTGQGGAPDSYDMSWISVYAIPTTVVSECPDDQHSGGQVGYQAGAVLGTSIRPNKDSSGAFHNQIAARASTPETDLICAYTSNEVGSTKSRASLRLTIVDGDGSTGGGGDPGAEPANVKRPVVKRSAKRLTCARGKWSNASKYSYRWLVNGKKGAKGRRLRITRKVRGHAVQCVVKASNAEGTATKTSLPIVPR